MKTTKISRPFLKEIKQEKDTKLSIFLSVPSERLRNKKSTRCENVVKAVVSRCPLVNIG